MRVNKMIIIITMVIFIVGTLAFCVEGADNPKTIQLRIGGGHTIQGFAYTSTAQNFFEAEISKRVEERTNYRIKWIEAYGGTIAKLADAFEATESGLLDVGVICYAFEPTKMYLMNMNYYIPFNTPDPVQATRITRKVINEYQEIYDGLYSKYNQKLLGTAPTGGYELISMRPVSKLEDIKGMKIAAAGPNLTLLKNTGAIPVQSNLLEAYTSFQTGVYEGWIMYSTSTYGFKLQEIAKYQINVGFGACDIQGVSINLDTFNKLPKEVQDIFIEVGREYEVKAAEESARMDKEAMEKMEEQGVTITDLPKAEKVKWMACLPNVPNSAALELEKMGIPGKKIFSSYLKYLEEDGYEFPRRWKIDE